jgi:hypothetical protein
MLPTFHATLQTAMQTTKDIKARCSRLASVLENIAVDPDATFADPRGIFIDLVICEIEIESAIRVMRKVWWP